MKLKQTSQAMHSSIYFQFVLPSDHEAHDFWGTHPQGNPESAAKINGYLNEQAASAGGVGPSILYGMGVDASWSRQKDSILKDETYHPAAGKSFKTRVVAMVIGSKGGKSNCCQKHFLIK